MTRARMLTIALVLAVIATACSSTTTSTSATPSSAVATTEVATEGPASSSPASAPDLGGLPFDEFLEASFARLLVRNPENLTSLGVAADYGLGNDRLNDWSPAFLEETQALERSILEQLRTYDRSVLPTGDQVSYDVYEWYLDQQVRGHPFAYHEYPVHHFVNSYNFNLILFLTEEHPLATVADADDYITRLEAIRPQVNGLLERLRISDEMGIAPPALIVNWAIGTLREDLGGTTTATDVRTDRLALFTAFEERLDGVAGLDEAMRADLLDRATRVLAESFVPAWISLIDHLRDILPRSGDDPGVWRLPDGDDFYAWLLRDHTSTAMTPDEVHQLGQREVGRVEMELRAAFDRLGYPSDRSIGELRQRARREAGSLDGTGSGGRDRVVATYEGLIAQAEVTLRDSFGLWPSADVGIVAEPAGRGGYYVSGSVDGSRPGAFHAGVGGNISLLTMPTITYHEAVPGHHTQIAIAQELDLPTFRRFIQYNGFAEGWALYAERLAAETGLYTNDGYGDIGRLELELLRAVRLVVDTGIHSLGWSHREAKDYMDARISGWSHEVERYMVLPGQATGYMIGMLEILDLRDDAAASGITDLAEFHDLVLGGGSMPLEVLETTVAGSLGGG
ncbi:MAG: DUF885 domain-containing protein [Acidimicrobiia bacterium]|nr:DUF885 domain-containing protein [Acidimicrobiia bacterium]